MSHRYGYNVGRIEPVMLVTNGVRFVPPLRHLEISECDQPKGISGVPPVPAKFFELK
jgi:hypothetical protein